MILAGNQAKTPTKDLNQEYLDTLKGFLDDKTAKITLAKFLRKNLGFTIQLLTGGNIILHKFQEMILRSWFLRNFCLNVWGRGVSKSYTVAIYCFLYCIFNPNTKVIVVSANFRTARRILAQIQTFANSRGAEMLLQCFDGIKPERRPDEWKWDINGGFIAAYPLGSENLRGIRADVLVIDEASMVPQETIEKVLMPFLVAKSDQDMVLKIREKEDQLIRQGLLKEEDRIEFDSNKRMIFLSSASYQFEYLYKLYLKYLTKIGVINEEEELPDDEVTKSLKDAKYLVSQLSYKAVSNDLIDASVAKEAEEGGAENNTFKREYEAQFVDDSGSFFSAAKMTECTLKPKESPCIRLEGDPKKQYILAIDPNRSASTSSDHFAMNLLELNPETQSGILIHNYAASGAEVDETMEYFAYMLTYFNVAYIIADHAGGPEFIATCNASQLFKDKNLKIDFFEADFDNNDYQQGVKVAKRSYNLLEKKIGHDQNFHHHWIRKANEHLQTCFQQKKILFASPGSMSNNMIAMARIKLPIQLKNGDGMEEFIGDQDDLITLTKKECALIEISSTATGIQHFDLPAFLKRGRSADKARKDSYTTLLLAAWGMKCFYEMNQVKNNQSPFFIPFGV